MEKKKLIILLVGIFFLALILRIGFISTLDNTVDVWGDWWDELGWKLATGQGYWVNNPYFSDGPVYYSWRPPGFPLFLAGVYKLFGHSFLAAKICLAIVSSITCLLLFSLGRILLDNRSAILTSLLYVFYPPGIFWTGYLVPVTLEIFFALLTVYLCFLAEKKQDSLLFFISGFVLGFGVLTRSLFLVFIPAIFIWLTVICNVKFALKNTVYMLLSCFIVMTPWILRNYHIHKTILLTSTEGGIVCYIANNEKSLYQDSGYWDPTGRYDEPVIKAIKGLSEVETDRYFYRAAFNFIKNNPHVYFRLVADRFVRFWRISPHTFSGPGENYKSYHVKVAILTNLPIFILAGLGFIFSLRKWREYLLIYLLIIFLSIPVILFFKTVIRYREPLMPFLIIMAVFGIRCFIPEKNK